MRRIDSSLKFTCREEVAMLIRGVDAYLAEHPYADEYDAMYLLSTYLEIIYIKCMREKSEV